MSHTPPPATGRPIAGTRFLLIANGTPSGQPPAGLRDALIARGAEVRVHYHPLGLEPVPEHILLDYTGPVGRRRTLKLPSRPPLTYPVDLLVPPRLPRAEVVIAFNNMHAARALGARRRGQVGEVVYSAVDFVPDRFGAGAPLSRIYDALDAWVCRNADARWEVSAAAREARNERHGLDENSGQVIPIGTWSRHSQRAPEDGWAARRVIFVANLVERMGGLTVVEAIAEMSRRGQEIACDVVGSGPDQTALERRANELGVHHLITFHGFVHDQQRLASLLAASSIALAPYRDTSDNFTRFADPSKVKSYLAAGLPTILTRVPPNATELERDGGATLIDDSPTALADAIGLLLGDPEEWRARRADALTYAAGFDWSVLLRRALAPLGFT